MRIQKKHINGVLVTGLALFLVWGFFNWESLVKSERKLAQAQTVDGGEVIKDSFSLVVIADAESYKDSGGYNPELVPMLQKAASLKPDFTVFSGDIITTPGDGNDYARIVNLKNLFRSYLSKFYIVFGHHDVECEEYCVDLWQKIFFGKEFAKGETRNLYYAFNYGNTHFVLLSSDFPIQRGVDNEQFSWLEEDLAANELPNVIVFSHVSPVTFFEDSAKDCHDMSCNPAQRDELMRIFERYGVNLVISGHEHAFDHKVVNGVNYLLAGNTGNSPRWEHATDGDILTQVLVNGERITVRGLELDGGVVREIGVR